MQQLISQQVLVCLLTKRLCWRLSSYVGNDRRTSSWVNVFSLEFILMLVAIVTISSFGVAGVGGGATFASLIVLGAMNLPVAIVGLVISVEPLIDMARTAVNVSGSMVAGIVTSARIKDLDRDVINDDSKVIDVNA